MTDPDELLRLDRLEVHFPIGGGLLDTLLRQPAAVVRAVDGVDLTLRRGEVLALVGESGSGKTTIGRVIVKLTRPTAGRLMYEGRDVTDVWSGQALRDYRRRAQIIFQDPYETLDPKQTIFDFVAEPLVVNGVKPAARRRETVLAALEATGLRPPEEYAARYPHELSGGQRQRVVIAGALVMNPAVIVADEPVSMLDVSIRTELLRLMLTLRHERELTYLFITHDLSLAWVIADRIAVMYLGRIMEIADSEKIYQAPRHPYTHALTSAVPLPDPHAERNRERILLKGDLPSPINPPSGCVFRTRCPKAQQRCADELPLLRELAPGHWGACHFPEEKHLIPT
jgi:oligopeptide/dipeptide ABC transporter ATP-binding protein